MLLLLSLLLRSSQFYSPWSLNGALTACVLQSWGVAISAQDAGRLAWALAAMDALQEDALHALAPQLSMLGPDDSASLAGLFQVRQAPLQQC